MQTRGYPNIESFEIETPEFRIDSFVFVKVFVVG
jgi:hypothetical protein